MSNQRRGKTYRASAMDNGDAMRVVTFFKQAKDQLILADEGDAAFYFEFANRIFHVVIIYTVRIAQCRVQNKNKKYTYENM